MAMNERDPIDRDDEDELVERERALDRIDAAADAAAASTVMVPAGEESWHTVPPATIAEALSCLNRRLNDAYRMFLRDPRFWTAHDDLRREWQARRRRAQAAFAEDLHVLKEQRKAMR